MITLALTEEQAVLLQNFLTYVQGQTIETVPLASTQLMELRLLLEDAMGQATPRACRVILYYRSEELQPGQLPSESSVEITYENKKQAMEMMLKMIAVSRQDDTQPVTPRNYVLRATPGNLVTEMKGVR